MVCIECQLDVDVAARCAGDNCRASICPLCFDGDGLCSECRAEERFDCPPLSAELIAILLSGATVGSQRLPLCGISGEPAAKRQRVDSDDINPLEVR